MSEISIDYTARDYNALKADIINLISTNTGTNWTPSDNSDLGNVLVEAFAYMGDIMSYYLDRVANETTVATAVKTDTLLGFASLYGYKVAGPTPATVTLTFTNNSSGTYDLPIGTQVLAPLTYGPYSQTYFETTVGATQIIPGQTINLTAVEGKTVNTDREDFIDPVYHKPLPANVGTSDGSANQTFVIYGINIISSSVIVYVGQGVAFAPWTYVDTLVEYGPSDLVFTTQQNTDGTLTVIFGDGINGAIPTTTQLISSIYKVSVGSYGNVKSGVINEISFIPGNIDTAVPTYFTVSNSNAAIGGADGDTTDALRDKIRGAVIARRRAVTKYDYTYLATQVPLVGKANTDASVYSSVNLYIQSANDGTSTPGISGGLPTANWSDLQTAVSAYMADKTPVGTTLTVLPPTYVPLYLTVNVSIQAAQKQSTMKLAINKALVGVNGYFDYPSATFGRSMPLSAVYAAIQSANNNQGVVSSTITQFNIDGSASANTVVLSPSQIAYLPQANLTINITGGIPL